MVEDDDELILAVDPAGDAMSPHSSHVMVGNDQLSSDWMVRPKHQIARITAMEGERTRSGNTRLYSALPNIGPTPEPGG